MRLRGLILLPVLLSSGCSLVTGLRISEPVISTPEGYRLVEVTPRVIQEARLAPRTPAPLPPLAPGAVKDEYRVGPGDVLSVVVWGNPELTNPTGDFRDAVSAGRLVTSEGTIFYPHIGTFMVAGKTVVELRREIAQQLARVIRDPQVDVRVVAFRSQRIQVTGEVRQPGLVTLDDTAKGVLEAINERGGLNSGASRREAILIRADAAYRIDIAALHTGSRPGSNPELRPGDVIHVPDKADDQVFVLGEVPKPAPVLINSGFMSLTEALTNAGGLDHLTASDSGVLVFRRPASDNDLPTVFSLDMSEPQGLLLAGEFELQPRDVVYVKATAFAQYNIVINQLLPTITAIFNLDRLLVDR